MLHPPLSIQTDRLKTPIGVMTVATDFEENLRAADWDDCEPRIYKLLAITMAGMESGSSPVDAAARRPQRSSSIFKGNLSAVADLLVCTGGTAFQRDVWDRLRDIPRGTTISYSDLASLVGRPADVRAVATANGCNPVGVVVPCHRVIGSDGSLTGYAGSAWNERGGC